MRNVTLITAIFIFFAGCELYEQDSYQEYYVVEAYLIANDILPELRLSTTTPVEQEYEFEDNAVVSAEAEIRLLNPDSSIAQVYPYEEFQDGIYVPQVTVNVQSERLYQLHVVTQANDTISATTYVPGSFETVNELQSRYTYQSEEQIEVTTTPSSYISGRQTFYIFSVNVIDPDSANLTPFYRDLVFEQENEISGYYINSSGIINEGNYDRNENGNITLTVPWLAVAFYETNDIVASAIDNNMYDFLRSQDVQTGGSNLSPGEIQNVRYNVNGGIGIFGSLAADTNRVYIERPQPQAP
jgi:hypothetical protein